MNNVITIVLNLLETEIAHQQRHLGLLQEQRAALVACDRNWFMALHTAYEELLTALELHAKERAKIVPGGADRLRGQMTDWPEADRRRAVQQLDRLRSLLALVRSQSNENRVLINNERNFVDFELTFIMNAITRGEQYVSTGAPASLRVNRLINKMV